MTAMSRDPLSSNPTLRDLMQRAERHRQAETDILAALPEPLAQGVRFLRYQEGELVLSVPTSTQASQLRFRQHELMTTLRQQAGFEFLWKLRIKVAPPRFVERKPPAPLSLSKENARLLKEEAGHTKDTALREVLEKLASHIRS